jgi:DNA-binding PadR family transcriptional regulator
MAELKIINMVKFYVLLLLHEGPKHGYDIIKEIGEKLGKKASSGQIYPFLKKLEKKELIKRGKIGKREKKVYSLTKDGEKFLTKMIHRFGNLIDIAVEPKLTVCAHCACKVYSGGYKERIKGKPLTFCCSHCAKSYKK